MNTVKKTSFSCMCHNTTAFCYHTKHNYYEENSKQTPCQHLTYQVCGITCYPICDDFGRHPVNPHQL